MGVEAVTVNGSVVAVDVGLGVGNGVTAWAASPPQPTSKIMPAARMTNKADVNAMQWLLLDWKGLCVENLRAGAGGRILYFEAPPFGRNRRSFSLFWNS